MYDINLIYEINQTNKMAVYITAFPCRNFIRMCPTNKFYKKQSNENYNHPLQQC